MIWGRHPSCIKKRRILVRIAVACAVTSCLAVAFAQGGQAIAGKFVEAETGGPIAGIAVKALAVEYSRAHRLLIQSGRSVISGQDGSFRIDGGEDSPHGLPIALQAGSAFDLGNIPRARQPLYRVDGAIIKDRFVDIDPGDISPSVQFTVADKAAAVQGTVSKNDAKSPAKVLLIPWPIDPHGDFPEYFDADADAGGKFSIAGLPPGSYHVLAVTASAWSGELQRPGVLAALAAGAKEIALDAAATLEILLERE
jgi:hypothetical protein